MFGLKFVSIKLLVLLLLILFFAFYNFKVYKVSQPVSQPELSLSAQKGQALWLKKNCNSCHQFYGLGGYLGPDLTNVIDRRDTNYIKAILNSGISTMPQFDFSEEEKDNIIAFLKEVNSTGYYPDKQAIIEKSGWIQLNEKDEKK